MSMEHKAYLLDYAAFKRELAPLLEISLASGDTARLAEFIDANRVELVDPYEGEPLGPDWRDMLEVLDAHQLGDVALTKFYNPRADIGLAADWPKAENALRNAGLPESLVLGAAFGPASTPFDPGKMGSYMQSEEGVRSALARVERLPAALCTPLDCVRSLLRRAADAGRGLYVTF